MQRNRHKNDYHVPILIAEKITKTFAGIQALKNIDLKVNRGEIHCLVGENGCGKSTLIKCISGVYTQDSGYIILKIVDVLRVVLLTSGMPAFSKTLQILNSVIETMD